MKSIECLSRLTGAEAIADVLGGSLRHLVNGRNVRIFHSKGLLQSKFGFRNSMIIMLRKINSRKSRALFEVGSTTEQTKLLIFLFYCNAFNGRCLLHLCRFFAFVPLFWTILSESCNV